MKLRYIFMGLVALFGLFFVGCRAGSYIQWSEGDREGKLIKFSKKGFPVKHFEGDLSTGALGRNNSSAMDQSMIWHFSVNSPEVAKKLQETLGEEVILHYKQYLSAGMWNDTDYIVTDVKQRGR